MITEYDQTCFVIMPFGRKPVGRRTGFLRFGERTCDFDVVYDNLFRPAVESARLPEGGRLRCRRADRDFFAGVISEEMFNYLEYSRLVLADISSVNANVFYELGVRHRARSAGTVVFRQLDAAIPFDINQVRTFPYEIRPKSRLDESKRLVTSVLERSLLELRIDSSVQLAIRNQRGEGAAHPALEELLRAAENDIRSGDKTAALARFESAVTSFNAGPFVRLKLGWMYRDRGNWVEALRHFNQVVADLPTLADGYREKGIAEQKRYQEHQKTGGYSQLPSGEEPLRHAAALSAMDYDARASLGGVLKREGRFEEAFAAYREASEISQGHPYPLLNEIKMQAAAGLPLLFDEKRQLQLGKAARLREAQTDQQPPSDSPWSFFDLGEIRLYQTDAKDFLKLTKEGVDRSEARWQISTHRESLELVLTAPNDWFSVLDRNAIEEAVSKMKRAESLFS